MRFFFKRRRFAVLVAALMVLAARAEGQGIFLSATGSPTSLQVSNSLTYTVTVTNNLVFLSSAVVSNSFPSTVRFVSANPGTGVTFATNAEGGAFYISGFNVGTFVQMTLIVQPTAAASLTNWVRFYSPYATNVPSARVVTQVTNAVPPQADLGVAISLPTTAVLVNDWMTYTVSVTNRGPDAAPGGVLTNLLPSGVILKSDYIVVSNTVYLGLGTLSRGGVTNFQFTLQPTNAGALSFFASVGASGVTDTNTANNRATNSLTVTNDLGTLVAVTNSAQIINLQNGLIEQSIRVSNTGTNAVAAVRVVVSGLTNRLANAVGTNSASPFVVYTAPQDALLGMGQSVLLRLQYAPRKNFPFTNSQLQAFAVPPPDLTPPAGSAGTNVNISRIVPLSDGSMLLEFAAITNRTYTVVYADTLLFSNALIAPPAIVAPANGVQWIDYGPPATASVPAARGARFYRVFLNP